MNSGDFVIATQAFGGIKLNSVGVIEKVDQQDVIVLFIGVNQKVAIGKNLVAVIDITQTGKGYAKKICNICAILKDDKDFDINQTDAKGMKTTRPSCKDCRVTIDGKQMTSTEKKRMAAIRPKGLFKCPICEKTGIIGITVSITQDHSHIKRIGRDWICDSCNTGLGRFKDDITILQRAIDYLIKHN